ncbi:hypothetical protein MKQ70_33695 [Chitinophaga sedimenti]|nr:RuvA C-terminal domain-containing protein [Chitinophaga sedimenti]MCK7559635.1 hypothetical protein [Chitinophaga sedimenti]
MKKHKEEDILNISVTQDNTIPEDALNALVTLGIARNMAEQAIRKVLKQEPQLNDLEALIKKSLKSL